MLKRELDETIRIAREAGQILMQVYATDFGVAYKGATDPVTDADTQANAYIVAELARLFPDDGIVAEETPTTGSAAGKSRCWYVDPLDGTKEFIAKNGEFSVMIGLAIDGGAVLGVVFQPSHDKLYAGVVDETSGHAFLVEKGVTRELRVSEISATSELKLVVSRSHRDKSTDALVQQLGITRERPSGSVGLKVGLIAEREADLYIHPSNRSSRWDACAPDAILRAAGGVFLDLAGERYRYDGVTIPNERGIFACNRAATPSVLEAARTAGRAAGLPC
jgi:3'(2'), 5'-bisphosphate nucleotidase